MLEYHWHDIDHKNVKTLLNRCKNGLERTTISFLVFKKSIENIKEPKIRFKKKKKPKKPKIFLTALKRKTKSLKKNKNI